MSNSSYEIRSHSTLRTVFLTAHIRLNKKNPHHTVHSHLPDERTSGKLYFSIAGIQNPSEGVSSTALAAIGVLKLLWVALSFADVFWFSDSANATRCDCTLEVYEYPSYYRCP
ncbi:hypothetical protein T06_8480 [Trichinella sp. T6]|nr:hypothetical protein T06_8480 [Trichinella sp. T6]